MAGSIVKALTTSIGVDALKPQIREWVNTAMTEWEPIYPVYLTKAKTTDAYEEDYEWGGMSAFPRLDEGDDLNFTSMGLGNKTRLQPDMFQAAFAVSERMRRLNRINYVETASKKLGKAGRVTVEQLAAELINYGFNPAFKGSDGQPLFSASHSNANGDIGISNIGDAATLSHTSLEAGVASYIAMKGPDGFPVRVSPKYLVTGPVLFLTAQRLVKSDNFFTQSGNLPDTTKYNQGVPNVLKQYNLQPVCNPYIVSTTVWTLWGDPSVHKCQVLWGLSPQDDMFRDNYTMDFVYSQYFEVTAGWSSYIGVYGNQGA